MRTVQFNQVTILSVSGVAKDRLCYEGCDLPLDDDIVCGLTKIARQLGNVTTWEFGRRNWAGHRCRPMGQGHSMFCLIVNSTAASFQVSDKEGTQLLGIFATKLLVINPGHSC